MAREGQGMAKSKQAIKRKSPAVVARKPALRVVVTPSTEAVDVGALKRMMGYALKRAQMAVFEDFIHTLRDTGLKPAQFSVLLMLHQTPGLTQSAVAQALGIQRANFVPLITELERRGWATRKQSETDRRSHALHLTEKGEALLARVTVDQREHEARVIAAIGSENADMMFKLLDRLAKGINR